MTDTNNDLFPDTDTIVTTDPDDDGPERDESPPDRIHAWWEACVEDAHTIPEAFTQPASLIEVWDYARQAAFTTSADGGAVRRLNIGWAAVTLPVVAVALLAVWALPRFGRAVAFAVAALVIGTGVSFIPLVGALVPDVLNITAW
jgi:hypothetical protein